MGFLVAQLRGKRQIYERVNKRNVVAKLNMLSCHLLSISEGVMIKDTAMLTMIF